MNIFLIYSDATHAEPFLAAVPALQTHGIYVVSARASPRNGVDAFLSEGGNWDLLVIHHELVTEAVLAVVRRAGRRIALLERIDGAQMTETGRRWLPRVDGVLKSYAFRDRQLYNEHVGRRFCDLLAAAGVKAPAAHTRAFGPPAEEERLSAEDLARKVHVIYGFASYPFLAPCRGQLIDWRSQRDHALCFRGTQQYGGSEIDLHRQDAAAIVSTLRGDSTTLPIGRQEYFAEMFTSRTVLSPWGWGEACHRDYEAMLLGAVVVKPDSDYVEAWPDVYRSGETYVACRPDLSGVTAAIRTIGETWPDMEPLRRRARKLVFDAGSPSAVAARLSFVLRTVMETQTT